MYGISPAQLDCYFTRQLLLDSVGPTSFDDLRTVNGELLSLRDACIARGLMEDDRHCRDSMVEAAQAVASASRLRNHFSLLLTNCQPQRPAELWQEFRDAMSDDFLMQHRQVTGNDEATYNDDIYNDALCALEDKVLLCGGQELSKYGIPAPNREIVGRT